MRFSDDTGESWTYSITEKMAITIKDSFLIVSSHSLKAKFVHFNGHYSIKEGNNYCLLKFKWIINHGVRIMMVFLKLKCSLRGNVSKVSNVADGPLFIRY